MEWFCINWSCADTGSELAFECVRPTRDHPVTPSVKTHTSAPDRQRHTSALTYRRVRLSSAIRMPSTRYRRRAICHCSLGPDCSNPEYMLTELPEVYLSLTRLSLVSLHTHTPVDSSYEKTCRKVPHLKNMIVSFSHCGLDTQN